MPVEREKQVAAEAAAELVEDGMTVGLGTGSTVAHLLTAIANRNLEIRCVATSPRTEDAARTLGIPVEDFGAIDHLDIAIDGTDQVAPDGWLVKGGGGDRFVVIADSTKPVAAIGAPIPLELLAFGLPATLRRLGPDVTLRDVPHTPDGGIVADYHGPVGDPAALAARLSATPGIVDHGLFAPDLVAVILVARGETVERTVFPR